MATLAPLRRIDDDQPDVVIARRSVRKALAVCDVRIPEDIGYCNLGVRAAGGAVDRARRLRMGRRTEFAVFVNSLLRELRAA